MVLVKNIRYVSSINMREVRVHVYVKIVKSEQ